MHFNSDALLMLLTLFFETTCGISNVWISGEIFPAASWDKETHKKKIIEIIIL